MGMLRKVLYASVPRLSGASVPNERHVHLFPQIKCAYNRVKKAANSSTLMFLADAMATGREGRAVASREYLDRKHSSLAEGVPLSKLWFPRSLGGYYWFTVVRSPYSRLLSAYLQKGQAALDGSPGFSGIPGFDQLDPEGFRRFVSFLENGGLRHDGHWTPQVEMLFLPPSRFDLVAKTETLARDLAAVLRALGLNPPGEDVLSRPHPSESAASWKVTSASSRLRTFYDGALARRVRQLYAADFDLLGYHDDLPS
jgi:hypothetical protein